MKKSRILSFLTALVLIVSFTSFSASAEQDGQVKMYAERHYDADVSLVASLEASVDLSQLRPYLAEKFAECSTNIDISAFRIPSSLDNSLRNYIWKEMPECFHVFMLGSASVNSALSYLTVSYNGFCDTADKYKAMLAECDRTADIILSGIEDNYTLDDVTKALLIHDRLAINCEYDYTGSETRFCMYGALAARTAVCEGYTKAYAYLLKRAGIDTVYCSSEQLDHAWNVVVINGKTYHVDVTWDDISWYGGGRGCEGEVRHDNFLRSTGGIRSTGHDANDFYSAPCDETYENAFWQDSHAAFQIIGDNVYYIDSTNENLIQILPSRQTLCSVSDTWRADGNKYWQGNFSRLATDGVDLFYSTSTQIKRYSLSNGAVSVADAPPVSSGSAIYGFSYLDCLFIIDVNKTPPYGGDYSALTQLRRLYSNAPVVDEHEWDEGTVTKPATCTESGEMYFVCKNNPSHTKTEPIAPLGHDWGEYVYNKDATKTADGTMTRVCKRDRTHTETVAAPDTMLPTFTDVASGAYYESAVDWAVENYVTSGTSKTQFSPAAKCTRAQFVTFLWRAAGSPEPVRSVNPFKDVGGSNYYYKAVLWALEHGITNGMSSTQFGSSNTCTRAQVVTFLWRAMGSGSPSSQTHSFKDVNPNGFYYTAMLWAVENGVTNGMTADSFAPGTTCTRGQVVTFLYRAMN